MLVNKIISKSSISKSPPTIIKRWIIQVGNARLISKGSTDICNTRGHPGSNDDGKSVAVTIPTVDQIHRYRHDPGP